MAKHLVPQLATLAARPPGGPGWLHEVKYDGYRILSLLDAGRVTLVSRNGLDWTERFGPVALALSKLPGKGTILDGEVVVEQEGGRTSFQALQNYVGAGEKAVLVYIVFDLLVLDGEDLRSAPLVKRKELLKKFLNRKRLAPVVRFGAHQAGDGGEFLAECCARGFEGIISKRADSPYVSGRSKSWIKCKCSGEEEFIIGGFTPHKNDKKSIGALLLGRYVKAAGRGAKKNFDYCGKVGTGFSLRDRRELYALLSTLKQPGSPFSRGPSGATERHATWVKPLLLAQVRFTELTADGYLRHPSFLGLREDKSAAEMAEGG